MKLLLATRNAAKLVELRRIVADAGLDGVEAFYPTHDEAQARLLYDAARERGLLTTGSADFHGPDHDKFSVFGGFETYGMEPVLGPIAG